MINNEMTVNEVKKQLYKQKPIARKLHSINGVYCYKTYLESGYPVAFEVPITDMGDAKFDMEMPAQLLIRWMV